MKFFSRFKKVARAPLTMGEVSQLAAEIDAIASQGEVDAQAIEKHSATLKVPVENLYAGLGMSLRTSLTLDHDLQFVVCVGNCRERGSLDCASTLLEIKSTRQSKSLPSFDIVPRPCLSRCQEGPAIEIRSRDGNAVLTAATPKAVTEAVKELLDS